MPGSNRYKVCSYPGCPELVTGNTRCEDHTVKADDTYRPSAGQRGYDRRWRTFARTFLHEHPNCAVTNCERQATDVDHIDNLGPLGPRGYDHDNLQPLCHQHHSARTAATSHLQRTHTQHDQPTRPTDTTQRPTRSQRQNIREPTRQPRG